MDQEQLFSSDTAVKEEQKEYARDLLGLPFPDFHGLQEVHDDLVRLVGGTLELHKRLSEVSFDSEKEPIERQIAATDKKIDELVYKLYGLTEEEIKIVEGDK